MITFMLLFGHAQQWFAIGGIVEYHQQRCRFLLHQFGQTVEGPGLHFDQVHIEPFDEIQMVVFTRNGISAVNAGLLHREIRQGDDFLHKSGVVGCHLPEGLPAPEIVQQVSVCHGAGDAADRSADITHLKARLQGAHRTQENQLVKIQLQAQKQMVNQVAGTGSTLHPGDVLIPHGHLVAADIGMLCRDRDVKIGFVQDFRGLPGRCYYQHVVMHIRAEAKILTGHTNGVKFLVLGMDVL